MRVGGKYSKDIWFWFLSFFPALPVVGRWCMEGGLHNLPYRHPRNNSAHEGGLSGTQGSDGLWPAGNPDGVACALAQHKLTPPEGFGGGSISISDPK